MTPEELRTYILTHNEQVARDITRRPIVEVLLSGGDPLILSNRQLYNFLVAIVEAGVTSIRIGTKELVFRPARFDAHFIEMLRIFHGRYPDVHIKFMLHVTHPDEFLERDESGNYISVAHLVNRYKWLSVVEHAVRALRQLDFVSLENQTAMIRQVNDDARALYIVHKELCSKGIKTQYTFQCRKMEGHKFFAIPVETAWKIHNVSQQGLTISERSRFVMSTECGKLEIVSVVEANVPNALDTMSWKAGPEPGHQSTSGLVVFKILRSPGSGETQGKLVLARSNPAALWISDYEDRIVLDGRAEKQKTVGLS